MFEESLLLNSTRGASKPALKDSFGMVQITKAGLVLQVYILREQRLSMVNSPRV